ncbi:hypothetical protein [Streptomyces avicenniae]|uniref:SCO2584 family spore wall biosynthesis protein n=1 Tax=Streptomyces avicenniae TaxID=500153 RepID=UPI00069C07F8
MPDDVGGLPFSDGDGPDSEDRHGAADEAFAAVVLDEAFVDAAAIHEPTAAERLLYAAMERAEERERERDAADEGPGAGPLFYRDPDLDPGSSTGLAGFAAGDDAGGPSGAADGPDPFGRFARFDNRAAPDPADDDPDALEALDALDALDDDEADDDEDDEGRFDRSDYLSYLPEEPEEPLGTDPHDHAPGGPHPDRRPTVRGGGRGFFDAPPPRAAISRAAPHGAGPVRWQRPVACVLAMVMGLSVLAFAVIAIQRAGSFPSGDPDPLPPSPSGDPGDAAGEPPHGDRLTGPTADEDGPGEGF